MTPFKIGTKVRVNCTDHIDIALGAEGVVCSSAEAIGGHFYHLVRFDDLDDQYYVPIMWLTEVPELSELEALLLED